MAKTGLREALVKSARAMYKSLPILLGVILLISLANTVIPKAVYASLFSGSLFLDSFVGGVIGSILAGNPITSYIIGGEFLKQGISLLAVTAFLVAWVTVGLVQLPAESMLLGKKFAIVRNITAFVFAIIVAVITTAVLSVL
ncbi:MAG: hypothetical protein U9O94_00510 [Nanoarchaeota archaeon]|nr:hypothetical protein [Nanoarchaeota archaeon]